MRFLIAIWVIVVLIGLLFIALLNLEEYGVSGYVLASVSVYALYKVFKLMFFGRDYDDADDDGAAECRPLESCDPLEYIIYDDLSDEWEE